MIRSALIACALLTHPIVAQQTQYATVTYLKAKPGMLETASKLQRDLGDKGAAATVGSGARTGYVRMVRLFPSGHETGHDSVYFYTRPTPPDLGNASSTPFLTAIGLTREQWTEKARATSDVVKTEIWSSVFAHGSLGKGDTVRLRRYASPPGKLTEARAYWKDYRSAMYGRLVETAVTKGMLFWELRLTPQNAPYNFVSLEIYAKGDGPFQAWGSAQEAFRAVHPGKDYHGYRETGDELGGSVGSTIYRVEAAIWK